MTKHLITNYEITDYIAGVDYWNCLFCAKSAGSFFSFFGNLASITLPIAAWVFLFVAAGAITSLLWRVILPSQRPSVSRNFEAERSRPYTPPPSPPRTPIASDYRPPQDYVRSPVDTPIKTPVTPPQSDWEKTPPKEEWDDWEIEKPSLETTPEPPQTFEDGDRSERKLEEDLEKDNAPVFEVEQQPKTSTRTGSVYSYTYREPKDKQDKAKEPTTKIQKEERKSDRVYDANYRVIRPPYRENVETQKRQDEEDEDWL